jgi:biotin synthase-like enzyme
MMTGDYLTSRGASPDEDLKMLKELDLQVVSG